MAAALLVPRLVKSGGVETRIRKAVLAATGRELSWTGLDVGLVPPRLLLEGSRLAGPSPGAAPFVEARTLGLRLALLPLVAGVLVVDSLEIEGATLRLERGPDGIHWPRPPREEPRPEAEAEEPRAPRAERRRPRLAVRSARLRDVAIVLDDRAVSPPITWTLGQLSAEVAAAGAEGPVRVVLDSRVGEGGHVQGRGLASLDRSVDLCLELDDVALAPLRPYLRGERPLDGTLSGKLRVRGAPGATARVALVLALRGASLDVQELRARGDLDVQATLLGPPFAGPFAIDATGAELEAAGSVAFRKPLGMAATASGELLQRDGRYAVEDVRVEIGSPPSAAAADPCAEPVAP